MTYLAFYDVKFPLIIAAIQQSSADQSSELYTSPQQEGETETHHYSGGDEEIGLSLIRDFWNYIFQSCIGKSVKA